MCKAVGFNWVDVGTQSPVTQIRITFVKINVKYTTSHTNCL